MKKLKDSVFTRQLSHSLCLCFLSLLLSCEYNIHDYAGLQVSRDSNISKKHDAFICSYAHPRSVKGLYIKEVFAEKQYSLKRVFYPVNDTMSQVVIVFDMYNGEEREIGWKFKGFEYAGEYGKHKKLEKKGIDYPDSLSIDIISLADSSVLETMVLHKMKAVDK
jgi:hypothetical protein